MTTNINKLYNRVQQAEDPEEISNITRQLREINRRLDDIMQASKQKQLDKVRDEVVWHVNNADHVSLESALDIFDVFGVDAQLSVEEISKHLPEYETSTVRVYIADLVETPYFEAVQVTDLRTEYRQVEPIYQSSPK